MSHVQRLVTIDRIFFVTVNLLRGQVPLSEEEFPLVLAAIDESRRRLGFLFCGYVLMPDHWHALISTDYPLTISRVLHNIKWISARSLNARRRAQGPVWQHQFWDRFVRNPKEFGARFEYMHLNPVRKGLVNRPEERRWSSFNNYALETETVRACPIQVDDVRLPEGYRG